MKKFLPYFIAGFLILALVFVGSLDKINSNSSLSLSAFAAKNYKITVDQISELYVVADLSDALSLASADDTASNYVITTTMYQVGQTSDNKIDKVHIVDTGTSNSVIFYTVKAGDTMENIAYLYGLTTDQIRWSNKLKTTSISEGDTLYLPTVYGIVYTVKSSDTLESIAKTYGSSVDEIIAINNLQNGLSTGTHIAIKGGSLPETERPEYVAPVRYTYTYLGSTSERQDIVVIQYNLFLSTPYTSGQCTSYAWYKRQDLPGNLGNAYSWGYNAAAAGYLVDHNPSAGAVFQTSSGYYGHVGYVESVNSDGSIVVTEMNYGNWAGRVIRATIPASVVGNFYYIH